MAFDWITRVFPQKRADIQRQAGQSDPIHNVLLDIRDGSTPVPLGDGVFAVVGTAQTVIRAPSTSLAFQLRVEAGSFLVRQGDQAQRTLDVAPVSGGTTFTVSGHAYDAGDGPVLAFSDDTLPAPVVSGQLHFIGVVDANTLSLHSSRADALAGTNPVTFTSAGAGTITLGQASIASPTSTDLVSGDNAITLTSGTSERFYVPGNADHPQSVTVKGSASGATLLYWFVG